MCGKPRGVSRESPPSRLGVRGIETPVALVLLPVKEHTTQKNWTAGQELLNRNPNLNGSITPKKATQNGTTNLNSMKRQNQLNPAQQNGTAT